MSACAGLLVAGCSDNGGSGDDAAPKPDVVVDNDLGEQDGPAPSSCKLDDAADPVKVGGIFTLTTGGSASTQAANKDQLDFIKSEVNRGCGTVGSAEKGASVEVVAKDGQDDKGLTPGLTTDLIDKDGVKLIVGAGGSSPTVASAAEAVKRGIPYGVYFGTSDSLSGCTAAELADDKITKSETPVYDPGKACWDHKGLVIRTASLSTIWGKTVAKYVAETHKDAKKAAAIHRDDTFGKPIADQFKAGFEAAGGTVGQSVPYAQGTNKDGFKDLIKQLVQDDPEVVVGVWRIGELKAFLEAYVELGKDSAWVEKPAGYDKIVFVHAGSVRTSYADVSQDAIAVLAERSSGLQPYWDPESDGFKKWLAAYQDFDPDGKATVHTQMRTYDALMILVLATVKANSTDADKVKAELAAVAGPPGEKVYPGEFAKARALLFAGEEINYEGASGAVDLAGTGNIKTTPYQVWGVNTDGTSKLIQAYASAE